MSSTGLFVLAGAVGIAAVVAAVRPQSLPPVVAGDESPREESPFVPLDESDESEGLPPGHPPIAGNQMQGSAGPTEEPGDAELALQWKAPPTWASLPNPNSMRLATYRIPAAAGAPDDAELSVVQAGGTVEANFGRWVEQFVDVTSERRATKTVHRLKVSTIDVSGTFRAAGMGGMPAGDAPAPEHREWSLKGAVVETGQGSYFFKLTGPSASVRAARNDFDALLNSVTPVEPSNSRD